MSDAVWTALISGLVTIVTTIAGIILVWLKAREAVAVGVLAATEAARAREAAIAAHQVGEQNTQAIGEVRHFVDGANSKLVEKQDRLVAQVISLKEVVSAQRATAIEKAKNGNGPEEAKP